MKNRKNNSLITIAIILAVILLAIVIIAFQNPEPEPNNIEEITKCLGSKTTLYTQLGCHACEAQEKIFGENYQYLNVIDCFHEREKCSGIQYTPTWKINNRDYTGVKDIQFLQNLTGC